MQVIFCVMKDSKKEDFLKNPFFLSRKEQIPLFLITELSDILGHL